MSDYGFFIGTAVFVLIVEFVAILKSNYDEMKAYRRGFEDGKNYFNRQYMKPVILDTSYSGVEYKCPACGIRVRSDMGSKGDYCSKCGCEFDWSEIDASTKSKSQ